MVSAFFKSEEVNLKGRNYLGLSVDGAPSMLVHVNGFAALSQKENSSIQVIHCMVHRQALVVKEPGPELETIINVIKVNFVKFNAHTQLLRELCEDGDFDYSKVFFYSDARWLSPGNVLDRV